MKVKLFGRHGRIERHSQLFIMAAVILFSAMSVKASAEMPTVSQVPGVILWVDVKLGTIQIKLDKPLGGAKIRDYRITRYETRVKDPSDQKFLTIDDLRA